MRDLATQFDTSTADGMMQYAKALQSVNPAMAQQAAAKAQEMALTESKMTTERARQGQIGAQEQRAMAETKAKEAQTDKAARFEEALNALPPTATDADVEAVTRKFGKPEDVLKAVSRRQEVEAKKQAALELAKEKAQLEAAQKERDAAFRRELAAATAANRSALTGVQQQIAQQRLDDLKEKAAERKDKKEDSKQAALSHANKVLGDVAETNTLVKPATTGILGKPTSFIPGTDAYNLNQRLLTIKANLGFDRLQQMRDASPTGGALGQVAVQELQALQATVGSLDIGQDSKELAKNLSKIEHHYSNWIRTTRGEPTISFEEFQKAKQPAPQAPQAPAGGWSIKPKQ
jgi:chemotaxis protein histidine kinase CheA